MFNRSSLFPAFTLAVYAVAGPAPSDPAARGAAIPMRKRSSPTRGDGVFEKDKTIASTVSTINKHRPNLINSQKNTGVHAFNEGAEIRALRTVPTDIEARMHEKRQSEPLTDEKFDEEWAGTISVGTPAQKFVIGSGSAQMSGRLGIPS
ncbi:hypothetical protein C8R43DRAFT_960391 [Mycena crocata]|nr:hypothetical protein C8R43DRAFT_960391 [Mycena crocata]